VQDFTFSEQYNVIYKCKKNQENAHLFYQRFNSTVLSSTCFEHPSVHHQENGANSFMVFYRTSI